MLRTFAAALVATTALVSATAASAEPITVKFSHVVAENTPKGVGAKHFEACAEKALPGKVNVEVYPNSQLFGDNKVLEAMLLGDVHLAAPSLSKFGSYTEKLALFDLPFLFDDLAAAERFQKSAKGQELLDAMKDKGIQGLAYWHNGMKQLSASEPLRVPADAADKKFRIMSSEVLEAQFEAIDAVPLKKPFSEVFTLLQTNAIDGQENTWSNIYSQKFHEVQPYISESNHGLLDYLLVTNTGWWEGLPEDVRNGLSGCITEATDLANSEALKIAMDDRQKIIDSGISEVITLTPEEKQQWRAAMKPVWDKFADQVGQDMIDAAQSANSGS